MRCPYCSASHTQVLETRDAEHAVRRRRACQACGQRFTTYERAEELALNVRKRGGALEPFDRDKLLRGLVRAAAKRPVGVDELEAVADAIAEEIRRAGGELGAEQIGELVLRRLHELDPVAYVRFASVYRNFSDVREFEAELARLQNGSRAAAADITKGASGAFDDGGSVRPEVDDLELPPEAVSGRAKRPQRASKGEE